jgi:hypothetical protein
MEQVTVRRSVHLQQSVVNLPAFSLNLVQKDQCVHEGNLYPKRDRGGPHFFL